MKRTIILSAILLFLPKLMLAEEPLPVGYNFGFGQNDYYSNAVYCDVPIYNKAKYALSGTATLTIDNEYSYILSGLLKGKREISENSHAGLVFGLSKGTQKSNDSSVSSSSYGVLFDRNVKDISTFTLQYMHDKGSIYSEVYRNILVTTEKVTGSRKKGRAVTVSTSTALVTDTSVSEYSADTAYFIVDLDLNNIINKLTSTIQLSYSKSSEDIESVSFGCSFCYHITRKVSVSTNFTNVNNNLDQTNNYYGLGISRTF